MRRKTGASSVQEFIVVSVYRYSVALDVFTEDLLEVVVGDEGVF
jgi:hypothetical protein